MSASTLGKNISRALYSSLSNPESYNSSTPSIANQIIASQITSYLLTNTKVAVNYSGTIPGTPPVPEILSDSTVSIIGTCSPPIGTSFDSWLGSQETNIKTGFMVSTGSLVKPITSILIFNFPTIKTYITQSILKSVHENNHDNPLEPVWTKISEGILNWLGSGILPTPPTYPANVVGTGIATITKIIIT